MQTIIDAGSKIWLDGISPQDIAENRRWGVTGATSNPKIVAELVGTGAFDDWLHQLFEQSHDDQAVAWALTDRLVNAAQEQFHEVWTESGGEDGYVSFELDPLIEDPESDLSHDERVARYLKLGRRWSEERKNRLIKVPGTPAGIDVMEELTAEGVNINVTLLFTLHQYKLARDAIWRGARRRASHLPLKSVYSVFISRIDAYAREHLLGLRPVARDQVGLVTAKRMWQANEQFWSDKNMPRRQEVVFASTSTKAADDPPDRYVLALVGGGIMTNPPQINRFVQQSGKAYRRTVDLMPEAEFLEEIDRQVDQSELEEVLLVEGIRKFAQPQRELIEMIARKRQNLAGTT